MTMKKIRVLGIESSCDETSVSIVEKVGDETKVLSNIVKLSSIFTKIMEGLSQSLRPGLTQTSFIN